MKDKLFHFWVVLLAVALVWGDGAAVWAAPPAQDGGDMLDFEKPDWGMTMQYPAGWTAEDLGDVVKFTADDYATFAVIQDDAFRDMKRSLTGVIQTALNKMGSNVMGLRVKPQQGTAGRREALISATDPTYYTSWLGYVVQFVAGDAGYVLVCAAPGDTFPDRQTVFTAMGESIKFAGLETPTPTPKPAPTRAPRKTPPTLTPTRKRQAGVTPTRTRTSTPSPSPQRRVTPQTETTPAVEAGLTSAREAYDLALPVAQEWSTDASLDWAVCEDPAGWQGETAGRCAEWELQFLENPTAADIPMPDLGPQTEDNAYSIIVRDGEVDPYESETYVTWKKGPMASNSGVAGAGWIDSTEAAKAFLDAGGADFVPGDTRDWAGNVKVWRPSPDGPVMWKVSASDKSIPSETLKLQVSVDGGLGTVETSSPQPQAYRKTLTLAEALALAQPKAAEWRDNARLTEATAVAGAKEPGGDAGKAGQWTLTFMSEKDSPSDMPWEFSRLDVADGKVRASTANDPYHGVPLPAGWPDSSEEWARLTANSDYPLLMERYPDFTRTFSLEGDSSTAYVWTVGFHAGAVQFTLERKGGMEPTETPAPAATPTAAAGPSGTPTSPPVVETTTGVLTSTVTARATTTPDASATQPVAGAPVFTFFFADWCGPCKQMRPAIDELKARYSDRIQFAYVNVDDPGGIEEAHKYSVKSLPTFVLVKPSGEIAGRWESRQEPSVFTKAFDALLTGAVN